MTFDLRGRRAIVTGASAGIGAEIARVLAAHGCHLVLVARRRDRLDALAERLGTSHAVEVDVLTIDLAEEDGPRRLIEEVAARRRVVDVLVNNAGFGIHGDGLSHEWADEARMIRLNVLAVAELTKHYGREMRQRAGGRILQVASTAAFQPCPSYAAYAATKAFVLHHAEALAEELRDSGVGITVVCPGSTNTEFFEISGNERSQIQVSTSLEPDVVAEAAVDALRRGRRTIVTGIANKLSSGAVRFLPRRLQAVVARKVLE